MVLLLPAAAGRPRRASRTRHGCGSAAIWLQPCATQRHGAMWCGKAQLSIRPGRSARLAPGPSPRRVRSAASPPQGHQQRAERADQDGGLINARPALRNAADDRPHHPGSGAANEPRRLRPNRPDPGTQAATRRVPSAAVSRINTSLSSEPSTAPRCARRPRAEQEDLNAGTCTAGLVVGRPESATACLATEKTLSQRSSREARVYGSAHTYA
jgi:hypothetical protein